MKKRTKLKNIADIKSGHLFRSKIRNNPDSNVAIIQLKDVSENGILKTNALSREEIDNNRKIDFLEKGDVLFKSKSARHVAALVREDLQNTVATVHYFVLRINDKQVLSDYLRWFLNQAPAQRYFDSVAAGTRVPIVNKRMLEDLEVMIPSLEIQQKIIDIDTLSSKEEELLGELRRKKRILTQALLFESIRKKTIRGGLK